MLLPLLSTSDITGGALPMGYVVEAVIAPFRWVYLLAVGYYLPRALLVERLNRQGFDFNLFDEVILV